MTKQEIISHFNEFFNISPCIKRFVIAELREKQYALFNKKNFIAHVVVNDKIQTIPDGEVLFCEYLNVVEDITLPMFQLFEEIIPTLKEPTVCLFFAKCNDTYKCGMFALEEPVVKSEVSRTYDENGLIYGLMDDCCETYHSGEIICKQYTNYHFKFKDGFECAIDENGIIWIKQSNEEYFDRPCMKYCFTEIKIRNEEIAKFILQKSCEIQDDEIITKRAKGYL